MQNKDGSHLKTNVDLCFGALFRCTHVPPPFSSFKATLINVHMKA